MCAHIDKFPQEVLSRIPVAPGPPPDIGTGFRAKHLFKELPAGTFRCVRCLATSSTGKVFTKCKLDALVLGHRVWVDGHTHYCVLCGSYSRGRLGLLGKKCPGYPNTVHLIRAKDRIKVGQNPATGVAFLDPVPDYPIFTGVSGVPRWEPLELEVGSRPSSGT